MIWKIHENHNFIIWITGAKKNNVAMGHICEERTLKHPTQHTNDFEDSLVQWVEVFIGQEYPKAVTRWENRIQIFSDKIRVLSSNKKSFF